MNYSIINEIDAEIARPQEARRLLAGTTGPRALKRNLGRRANAISVEFGGKAVEAPKRRLSLEARERIRQAQIKRWAAVKKAANAVHARKQIAAKNSTAKRAKRAIGAKQQSA